jgi:PAS domain S-box-containing protein
MTAIAHLFRDMAEKSLVGIYVIQKGYIRYANPRFAEIMGYDIDDLVGKIPYEETIVPEDRAAVVQNVRNRESGREQSIYHTFRIITGRGEVRNVEVYGSRTTYRGKPAVIGTIADITERSRWEKRLTDAEEMYRSICETSVEGIFQTSPAHELTMVNDSLLQMFGYDSSSEFISELTRSETGFFVDPEQYREFVRRVREHGYLRGFEAEQYAKDGRRLWLSFNLTPVKGADGATHRHVGTVVNITERREAENKIRRSEAGLRALIGSMEDVIVLVDRNGRYTSVDFKNPDVLNTSQGGLLEKHLGDAIPKKSVAPYLAAVRKALRTRRTEQIEYRVDTEKGERWFSAAISPMTDESAVSVARDITNLKETENELQEKSRSLEETNSALKALLRNMEGAKRELEEDIVSNIRILVMPHLRKLGKGKLQKADKSCLDAISSGLTGLASPLLRSLNQFGLTPKEIQVARHVGDGLTTKEIVALLDSTKEAIDMHRYNIRKKLGMNRSKQNLRSYILSLR